MKSIMADATREDRVILFVMILASFCGVNSQLYDGPIVADIPVFHQLSEGYKTFRIPGIVQSANGTLIAATEGRVSTNRPPVGNASVCYGVMASRHDGNCVDKDIVVKISSDEGATWQPVQALTTSNSTHFYSNPNLVLDHVTGTVWMVYYQCLVSEVYGHCTPLMTSSKDGGRTWSPGEVLEAVTALHIGGLGGGIQLKHQSGEAQNRLILPHDGNGVIYSDDHGQTWKAGNRAGAGGENQAAEVSDGTILMVLRHGGYSPTFCKSTDAGLSFGDCQVQKQLLDDDCQTSLLAISKSPTHADHDSAGQHKRRPFQHPSHDGHSAAREASSTLLLYSHPNSHNMVEPLGRQNMTLSISQDNGETWHDALTINSGPSAYSALTEITYKGRPAVACLYERSKDGPPVDFDTVAMSVIDVQALLQ